MRIDLAGGAEPQGARNGADIGIGARRDADRVILVDERGHLVDATALAVIAQSWKGRWPPRQAGHSSQP